MHSIHACRHFCIRPSFHGGNRYGTTGKPVSGRRGGIRPGAPIQTKLPPIIAERGACRTREILNTPIICRALSGKRQTLTLPGPYKKAAKPEPVLRLFDLVCLFGISFNQTDKLID
ncbi:hypothetical protein, partial [Neisseria gonorrhoeae]|uniref:hypothetical protein n=1 Tax=Neisseria gonorrhoeae TaxID=485 RepID=UPI001BC903B4